ncbi:hypothetical protein [Intrasporangium sp. YIM S08009]|uniref:hypothetical protein n=1 Tax=Intrasporangium zincisolvens TaxID=3080018 RepID=UPI002B052489|nr:hypothetical protein [Intrasporangium sp. YIM S08009]
MTTSPLRLALRARLTAAMRERDRGAVSALRTTLAALDNAEAVPMSDVPGLVAGPSSSEHVAGAAVGVGAAEVDRRVLGEDDERAVVEAEVASLFDAARHRRGTGDGAGAEAAEAAARLLEDLAASAS